MRVNLDNALSAGWVSAACVPLELKAAAAAELAQRGLEQRAFVAAALEALRTDPDGTLRWLAAHKPRGRPRHPGPEDAAR